MPSIPEKDLEQILEDLVRDGDVEAQGEGEARRYRITEKGTTRVEAMLRDHGLDPAKIKGALRRKP